MYIFLKTAKRPTKNHHDFSGPFDGPTPKSIKPGEVFLAISNGTIGQGARQVNIGNKQAIELLEKMLKQLKANQESSMIESSESHQWALDDIPF